MINKLVSVIIPVYNVEQYLDECIYSIINQTHKHLEIILVNDGSTDRSGLLCDQYAVKDNRIKVIHKKNEGPSIARNIGLDHATGDYILFLDSDDWFALDGIERCVSKFVSHPDVGVIRFALYLVDPHGEKTIIRSLQTGNRVFSFEESFLMWMRAELWHGMAAMYDRKVIHGLRFMTGVYSEDLEFTLALYRGKAFNTMFEANPIYYYRYNPDGTSQSRTYIMWQDAIKHWTTEIKSVKTNNPKKASQLAYGLFLQLKQEEQFHRRSGTSEEILETLQEIFSPGYRCLESTPIAWNISSSPIKDFVYWHFPKLWLFLRHKNWSIKTIRKTN